MKNKVEIITLNENGIIDFALARNRLLAKAKNDWVLFIDLDEIVTDELALEIDNLDFKKDGYFIKRKNYFLGKYAGTDKILRLARKSAGKWKRAVHEIWEVKGTLGELKNPIIHNTTDNLSDYIKKINFYSTLHAKANNLEGKKSSLFKIVLYPKLKFFQTFIKSRNFVFSLMQGFHSFLSWSKLYFLYS